MVARWVGSIILGLMLCSVVVTADVLTISNSKSGQDLVANGVDNSTITVTILNQSLPVNGTRVNFTVDPDPGLGNINPSSAITVNGTVVTTFTANKRAGTAVIHATTSSLSNTSNQKIIEPYPDETNITTSADWVIANGSDHATITIKLFNNSQSYPHYPIPGLPVTFSVNDSIFGTINPVSGNTIDQGIVSSIFATHTKSGTALIYGNVTYTLNGIPHTFSLTLPQKIDHDTPYRINIFNFSNEMIVGSASPFQLGFTDRWGNPIDNKRVTEQVQLSISSPPPDNGGFWDGSIFQKNITVPVDVTGIIAASVLTSTTPGWNVILVHPLMYTPQGLQAVADKFLTIEGIPGIPWSIQPAFDPDSYQTYADGVSKFHITYLLKDQYNNPVMNRSVLVETNIPGEARYVGTNAQGLAMFTYGPKTSIGMIWINATAFDNSSVKTSQQIWFVAQDPVDMLLMATPQTMASYDVNQGNADLIAKVVDELGNPVEGETVTFAIQPGSIRYDRTNYTITSIPGLTSASAVTDIDGNAIIQFIPGGFTSDWLDPNFTATATGRCNVTATWQNISRTMPLIWKNYPYLSVDAFVSSDVVQQNDTVDITIDLKGDGWALQPNPIDVILTTDRSGSMLKDFPDRMMSVRNASKIFVGKMSYIRDRVGLVTFGVKGTTDLLHYGYVYWLGNDGTYNDDTAYKNLWYTSDPKIYSDYATYDLSLTNNFTAVNDTINKIIPDQGTPMREALRASIQNLSNSGRSSAVKAIVLLSDGDYNWYGDPLARGSIGGSTPTNYNDHTTSYYNYSTLNASNQNMSNYAKNSNIKIYSIAFAEDMTSEGRATLEILANSTGGKYYEATATNIGDVYTAIAGDLKTEAGVNTTMTLFYDKVVLDYVIQEVNETNQFMEYQYIPGISSYITSYFTNGQPMPSHTPPYPFTLDQTPNWTSTPKRLYFDVGTIRLNQVWEAKYRLKMVKGGLFSIFGPNSIVLFNNGAANLSLPDIYVTVVENMTNTNVTTNVLLYDDVSEEAAPPNSPEALLFRTFIVNSTYTGVENVTEDIYIVTFDNHRYLYKTTVLTPAQANQPRTYRIPVSELPAGFRMIDPVANVWDAPGPARIPPRLISQDIISPGKSYINLS